MCACVLYMCICGFVCSRNMCMCVIHVYMWVHMCIGTCVHGWCCTCMCTYVETQYLYHILLQTLSLLFIEARFLSEPRAHQHASLASQVALRILCFYLLIVLEFQWGDTHNQYLHGFWGSKFCSSHLHSKQALPCLPF